MRRPRRFQCVFCEAHQDVAEEILRQHRRPTDVKCRHCGMWVHLLPSGLAEGPGWDPAAVPPKPKNAMHRPMPRAWG
jgi:hypothetical protein